MLTQLWFLTVSEQTLPMPLPRLTSVSSPKPCTVKINSRTLASARVAPTCWEAQMVLMQRGASLSHARGGTAQREWGQRQRL